MRRVLTVIVGIAIGLLMLVMVGIVAALPWLHLLQGVQ